MLGDLFYRLGETIGELGERFGGKAGAGAADDLGGAAVYDPETGDVYDVEEDGASTAGTTEKALLGAVGGWLVTRLLRPKPVNWPRVILAGVAASALADLVGRTLEDPRGPRRLPFAEDPEELVGRLGAGVAVAAGYASLLYPRIPGSPLFRGLAFGALEVAAAPRGGLVAMAGQTPGVKFPLQALALPVDEDAGPLSLMAFGLGLGLFYRYRAADDAAGADENEGFDDSDEAAGED